MKNRSLSSLKNTYQSKGRVGKILIILVLLLCICCFCGFISRLLPSSSQVNEVNPENEIVVQEEVFEEVPTVEPANTPETETSEAIIKGVAPYDITSELEEQLFECGDVTHGELYYLRHCEFNAGDTQIIVDIYGRELLKVDFYETCVFQFGEINQELAPKMLGFMATVPYENSTPAEARAWIESELPTLAGIQGDVREAIFGDVQFRFFGSPTAYTLEIGELPNP